ncbi:NACHT domain-containing protein [Oxynema sp. CENA135]|uniref:NB-ARC domain-containing protein n=1 Tax=Oxynema sp. CENA135 TaxID=984206 RepID=UPI00190C1D91|nr:NB-ARC domain-containing protein [Oxynema sp. CENA135]MBK4731698.1 NACHT domain-containing protein [Oxynema sp. CENA135]
MEIQEAIEWTDDRVFAKTGKRLDSLQRTILEGTLENQSYKQIAEDYHCTKDHTKRVAAELWKLLSDVLGEEVKKRNFKSTLERIEFSHISNFGSDLQILSNINFCSEICHYPKAKKAAKTRSPISPSTSTSKQPEQRHDLTEAPELEHFHNRTAEINLLKQWSIDEKIRIVNIFGLPGMGKTTLARELVENIKDKFDYIVWRNCNNSFALNSLKINLIQFFSQNQETKSSSLIEYLRLNRCLIILDDFQELFASGEFAGTYLPEAASYGKFLKEIARSPHNSCFLLLSWEKPTEVATLEGENRHCRSLQLGGLSEDAAEILINKGLKDEEKWGELIRLYGGNPSWLNILATTIEDLFNGSVDRLLSYPSLCLGDLEPILQEYYQRLSASEKIVIQWLANQEAADIFAKPEVGAVRERLLRDVDFLTAIQSLRKRGLIEKVCDDNGELLLAVPALFKEYVKHQ